MARATMIIDRIERDMRPLDEVQEKARSLNSRLGRELIHMALEDESSVAFIQNGSVLVHDIEGEPEVTAYNYYLGHKARSEGCKVTIVHWKRKPE